MIINEFDFVARKMKEEKDPDFKMYYYSAAYGILGRILHFQYDPQLAFVFSIFQASYQSVISHLDSIKKGRKFPPMPSEAFFNKLAEFTIEVKEKLEEKKDNEIYLILEKIVCHIHQLTGAGFYQLLKGIKLVPE